MELIVGIDTAEFTFLLFKGTWDWGMETRSSRNLHVQKCFDDI